MKVEMADVPSQVKISELEDGAAFSDESGALSILLDELDGRDCMTARLSDGLIVRRDPDFMVTPEPNAKVVR